MFGPSHFADVLPAPVRGCAFGAYRTFADTGGLVGPIALGFIVDRGGFAAAAGATGALCGLAAMVFATLARETVVRPG